MKCRLPVILLMLLVSGCAALPASVLDSDATSELAVPAVYSTDTAIPLSLLSLFGVLALCGVVVNDALIPYEPLQPD